MILRRFMKHVSDQSWFAVGLDVLVVITGIFLGMQVQQYVVEQDRQVSEEQYLERLHSEVEQLIVMRSNYDETRRLDSAELRRAVKILNGDDDVSKFTSEYCLAVVNSSYTTVPPFGLPTATELLSAGRLDQITSPKIRNGILALIQNAERARDLTLAISGNVRDLGRAYPGLIKTKMVEVANGNDRVKLTATCDAVGLRNSPAFLNDFNNNAHGYIVYAERGVLQVSQNMIGLHKILDVVLDIQHPDKHELSS